MWFVVVISSMMCSRGEGRELGECMHDPTIPFGSVKIILDQGTGLEGAR